MALGSVWAGRGRRTVFARLLQTEQARSGRPMAMPGVLEECLEFFLAVVSGGNMDGSKLATTLQGGIL